MVEKKKKKELSGSWIDEILGGKSDPLANVLSESEEEKKPPLPFISESSPLEEILGTSKKEEQKGQKTPTTPSNPLEEILRSSEKPKEESPAPSLSDILGGGKREVKEEKPAKKEAKSGAPTGVDLLGQILSGGTGTAPSKPKAPAKSQPLPLPLPKPKPPLGLQSIIGETKTEELSYAGRAKVLDAYGNVRILRVKGEPVPIYEIRLPKLSKDEENLLKQVRERAITEIQIDPTLIPNYEERRKIFLREVKRMLKEAAPHFSEGRIEVLAELIVQNMLGYGLLDPLVRDDNLEEIMVIGTNKPVYVWHRRFYMCKTNIVFKEERDILNIIERIAREVGRRIDQQNPLLDARLPDGSRVNATIPPISLDGPTITIRKFKKDPLTIIDLIKYGTMNSDVAAFLWLLVDGLGIKPANILVAGGTGSGKTTTLNALAMFIPPSERVISIEDTAELQLPVEHWVRLETRPPNIEGKGEVTMDDLVKNTLRMRPDRIIVGEVRGPEARTMFTAMNTGHNGALYDFSVIQLSDGRFVLIGDLLEELFEKYSDRIETYRDLEYVVLDEKDRFEVVSVGPDLKAGKHTVTRVWRRKVREGEKLIRVRTRTGNEVILTKTHPFFVFSDGDVVRKEAEKLKPGDRVAVMRKPPKPPQRKAVINPEVYAGISDYYLVPNGKGLVKVPNDGIPPEMAQYLLSINSKPVKLVREVNEGLSYAVGVLLGDGYISSDGYYISATFDDESYMKAFTSAISEFLPESEPQVKREPAYTVVTYGSRPFAEFLHRAFGIPKGRKESLDVPDLVLSNDDLLRHFIAGLFDADAYIDENGPAVVLTTRSENLARKVWYALQRLGIISTVSRVKNRGYKEGVIFRVTVRGVEDLIRFHRSIPLRHSRKREKLEELIRKYRSHRGKRTDRVPISPAMLEPLRRRLNLTVSELSKLASSYAREKVSESLIRHVEKGRMKEIRRSALRGIALALQQVASDLGDEETWVQAKRLELIADGDVYWDEVVSVEEVEPEELGIEYLYDLTVEEDHNYVANGILVSNCMGTIHSNSARETIVRLESPPMNVPRIMIPALDIIIMQVRFNSRKKGTVRRITEIAEISGIEGESIQLNKLYKYDPAKDELQPTEVPSRIINELARHTGMSISELEIEREKRKIILEWMMEKGIRSIEDVGHYIKMFYIDEEALLEKIERDSSAQIQEQIRNIS
ncbi:ATPase, T2SS/T4P/T4SS family [Thermococcus gammatolerans]|uniref:AAA family ATPase, type II secretion system protein, containing DOD-type homing endonuclease n=1 Tax=Thermococcus gammatolerans (strain DSM 15229 / JCM 11827 / EJ3) TaxID=593117 RepID=C5A387_THEGJ|nr:ATPase, T2SS/T4P/T4SS family [Thermococcus gammatolerans]ACS32699.1 AAA family ATPase, type II secretion system protein, containing DOD-type homing endonuclease [Thermococcus gammatolerans EJ3]